MRVLFVSWRDLAHPKAGGSEVMVDRLARGLRQHGHEVALLCGGPVGDHEYEVVSLGGTYTQYLRAPLAARRFRDWDLLVDLANGIPFFSPLWWPKPRLCLFTHVHADQWHHYFPTPAAKIGSWLEQNVVPKVYRSTDFAAISPSTVDRLAQLGVKPDRLHLMYPGLDPSILVEPRPKPADPTFVAVGRLARNKDIERLFAIWTRVRPTSGGRLLIVGDGPERKRLESIAPEGVEFTGRVTDEEKVELVGAARLLVHAAPREGWGLVIMEAAAQATPTVAFDVEGVRDAVVDGKTGILVRSDDEFVKAWVDLVADTPRRNLLGQQARERALGFTWDASVDQFIAAADRALERRTAKVTTPAADDHPVGLRRSAQLFGLYRREPVDPAPFYDFLARDTMAQLERHQARTDGMLVDIGGGPGYIADATRARGGRPIVVEYNESQLHLHGRNPRDAIVGDGQMLPLRSAIADVVHSSNVLEHVPEPFALLAEMVRVLKPDGIGYLSYTPWLSPWGGHETSPWHFLGGARAVRRYERKTGVRPKNEYGTSLFALRMGPVLRWFEAQSDVEVLWEGPRYWPPAWRLLSRIPVVGEVITWNHLLVFRRRPASV